MHEYMHTYARDRVTRYSRRNVAVPNTNLSPTRTQPKPQQLFMVATPRQSATTTASGGTFAGDSAGGGSDGGGSGGRRRMSIPLTVGQQIAHMASHLSRCTAGAGANASVPAGLNKHLRQHSTRLAAQASELVASAQPQPAVTAVEHPPLFGRERAAAGSDGEGSDGSTEPVVPLAVIAAQQREIAELRQSFATQMQAMAGAPLPLSLPTPAPATVASPAPHSGTSHHLSATSTSTGISETVNATEGECRSAYCPRHTRDRPGGRPPVVHKLSYSCSTAPSAVGEGAYLLKAHVMRMTRCVMLAFLIGARLCSTVVAFLERARLGAFSSQIVEAGYDHLSFVLE
jgi:hypothetical protein